MNIPRFWASSDPNKSFQCWHWSDESVEDARRRAEEKSRLIAQRWENGEDLGRYPYGAGAIREEIVQTIADTSGAAVAVITRNAYGSLVLNANQAMFIDVDFPPPPKRGLLGGLFGKRVENGDPQKAALDKLAAWATRSHNFGMRIYRTCAGLRCLVTSQAFDPTNPQTIELLKTAGSDPLYVRLCQAQACFRARLTPKPWRSRAKGPPGRYPFLSPEQEAAYRRWQSKYERVAARFSVCRLLHQVGASQVAAEIQPILALHDQMTAIASDRPLA
jgi:hypothetical protein